MPHLTQRSAIRQIGTTAAALACVAALGGTGGRVRAQSPALPPSDLRFEVASVKPNQKTFNEHFLGGGGAFSGVRTLPGGVRFRRPGLARVRSSCVPTS